MNTRLNQLGRTGMLLVLAAMIVGCSQENPTATSAIPMDLSPTTTLAAQPSATPTPESEASPMSQATATSDPGAATATTSSAFGTATGPANADVTFVRAVQSGDGTWTFHVTVEHPDTGWEDYADGWDVLTPDGTVLKPDTDSQFTRTLLHPHQNEQPFTRSQSGIRIPEDVTQVRVRAHDGVDGFGGREIVVDLQQASGPDFKVERN